ncbi:hypothetical protein JG687_00012720 [Phytophthora cactorum]|uniref:Uncharacterized protein n=1 Tax=Phytophthora cactorum TaxID=29920 RepID=A0A8T1U4N7_9STRA|nr:hypothetical protein JG687_00012720 [Phytophthora cactorum]
MAGKVSQNANAVKTTKRTLKPRRAMRTTKQSTQAPVLENAYSQTSVIQNEYPQTPAHQDAHTQQLETRLSVAVQDHTQHAANMEMPAALTPYQRMRELLSVKKLDREAGPREIPTVDDLQKYLQSDRSVFKTPYEANREDVDSMLLTVTVWNMESDSELLPTPGCVPVLTHVGMLVGKTWSDWTYSDMPVLVQRWDVGW